MQNLSCDIGFYLHKNIKITFKSMVSHLASQKQRFRAIRKWQMVSFSNFFMSSMFIANSVYKVS